MLFVIIGGLAGVLLGLRFKIFVLVPSILILGCVIVPPTRLHLHIFL
jgi:hypothetical protein